jgi:predicted transcriptional regulator of viral defense system
MAMRTLSAVPIGRLRDEVVGRGISALTLDQVIELTGLSRGAAREAMRRARVAGHFFAPAPGLYIPIPSEFSSWGVVPAMDFIDQLMGFLGRSYYVGLLSAAELHGAAHQRPQVFQVMVDRPLADRDIERVRLRFYERVHLDDVPVVLRNSRTAQVRVSSPETTVFDLAERPKESGSIDNVATIYGELVEESKLDAAKLVEVASLYPLAVARRVGWLLDRVSSYADTSVLSASLHEFVLDHSQEGRRAVDLLAAGGPRRGKSDARWGLVVNADVEPDL